MYNECVKGEPERLQSIWSSESIEGLYCQNGTPTKRFINASLKHPSFFNQFAVINDKNIQSQSI